MEFFILFYSVYCLFLFSQQSWARKDSRIIEVLMILSSSNSALVGSIATSAVTCFPQQLWGRVDCSQQRCCNMRCPPALGMGCWAEFLFWVKAALWKTLYLHVLGDFGTIKRTNWSRGHTVLVGNLAPWVYWSLFHKEEQKVDQRYKNTWWSKLGISFCDRKNNLLAAEHIS